MKHVQSDRVYVGRCCPIHETADGIILIGTRRFTGKELARYIKNMYGESYYRRQQIRIAKEMGHDWCSERTKKGWDTKRDRYGDNCGSEIRRKGFATLKMKPTYAQTVKKMVAGLQTPSAIAKSAATRSSKRWEIEWAKRNTHRYFICDCDINGTQYYEGEWLCIDDPDYEKANAMMVLEVLCGCTNETKQRAGRYRRKVYYSRKAAKMWLAKRPVIIFRILSDLQLNSKERRRNGTGD